jgi:hypothetical protein
MNYHLDTVILVLIPLLWRKWLQGRAFYQDYSIILVTSLQGLKKICVSDKRFLKEIRFIIVCTWYR